MISLTDEQSLAINGFQFWPAKFGTDGYLFLVQFKDKILQALFITLFVTIVGTACNVFITTTYASTRSLVEPLSTETSLLSLPS